jgi:predicted nucleic acid-binding protein
VTTLVVDANIVAKWFVPEERSEAARAVLDGGHDLAVPDLLWAELSNLLWKKTRAGEISRAEGSRIIQALAACPMTVYPSSALSAGAYEIALETGRSVYDALYLALAVALDCQMITADDRFVNALSTSRLAQRVVRLGASGQESA